MKFGIHTFEIAFFSFFLTAFNVWVIKTLRQVIKAQDAIIDVLHHMKSAMVSFENDATKMENNLNSRLNFLQQTRFSPEISKNKNQSKWGTILNQKISKKSYQGAAKMNQPLYASVTESDGVNYREIADTMSEIGFKMNHSSARNYVLRVMRKFATAITRQWNIDVDDAKIENIIKSPQFQQGICDILQSIEEENKK
jgi:hypothetical protein